MNAYADFVCQRRTWLAILILALTALAATGLPRLGFDEEPRSVFARKGPDLERLDRLFADFGPDDTDVFVAVQADDLFSASAITGLHALVERFQKLEFVESVDSILRAHRNDKAGVAALPVIPDVDKLKPDDLAVVRERALAHPTIRGQFLSDDGTTTFMIVHLKNTTDSIEVVTPQVKALREAADQAVAGTSLQVGMAGHPVARVDVIDMSREETKRTILLSALITTIVGLISFRNAASVCVALSGPMIGTLWTLGVLGWMGEKLNGLNTALPSLVYVIAFGDSVHLVVEFEHARKQGRERLAALHQMMVVVGKACVLMVFTTVVGFGSLAVAELEAIRRFGIASAVGTVLGFAAVLLVLPWMLGTRLGDFIGRRRDDDQASAVAGHHLADGWASRWGRWLLRFPRPAAAAAIVMTVGLSAVAAGLQPNIRWMEFLPEESATAQVTRLCDEKIGGSLPATVVVEWPEGGNLATSPEVVMREVHGLLAAQSLLRGPFSVLNLAAGLKPRGEVGTVSFNDVLRLPPDVIKRFVRSDLRRAAVTIHTPDAGATLLLPAFDEVERGLADIERRHPGYRCELTGTAVVAARNVFGIIEDALNSLMLSSVVIIATMMIAFRSVRLGLICIAPTMFPVVAVAAGLVILGEPLRIAGAMTFSVCLGLADDNTIHLVSRFRHELSRGLGLSKAVERALASCGPAMIIMAATLSAGLIPTVTGVMPAMRIIGWLTIAALAASVVADLLILPPLLACFARADDFTAADAEEAAAEDVDGRRPAETEV